MTSPTADTRHVVFMARKLLKDKQSPSAEDLSAAVSQAMEIAQTLALEEVDDSEALRWLESQVNVTHDESTAVSNRNQHTDWLPAARSDVSWNFWERYVAYLEDEKLRPIATLSEVHSSTDLVLGDLGDPNRPGPWKRHGLVLGHVQSGKTAHFIGLATKAADAGYPLIVILAGVLDDLRAQTQTRIDEGLLGFDTQTQRSADQGSGTLGAGNFSQDKLRIASLTTSEPKGDFRRDVAKSMNIPLGSFPVVLVIKKHQNLIKHVRTWVEEVHGSLDPETNTKIVKEHPLLVIDDEADNASINVKAEGQDPSAINSAIRRLLNSFSRSSYVGYTATPFANIYIDPEADDGVLGSDLFPAAFIRSLKAPSNYFGPERLFGIEETHDDEVDSVEPLPLIRHIDDSDSWIPTKHKSDFEITDELPPSLEEAIDQFLLVCASRRARGDVRVHNSMLVHVTRFTKVQGQVAEQVRQYVYLLTRDLRQRFGRTRDSRLEMLRQRWEEDFLETTEHFEAEEAPRLTWEQVAEHLSAAAQKLTVKEVNGSAKDALDYYENDGTGISVIAVGGQKLSRGLTLEGLSVSYYLRFSNAYDTLLQMGRWFGYRPGYEDLCRLWIPPSIEYAYREITQATAELRRSIDEMSALGMTPQQYGLKVRTSSSQLAVTAPNKARAGTRIRVSYQGELAETTLFPLRDGVPKHNFHVLERLVEALGSPSQRDDAPGLVWHGVSASTVVDNFFAEYRTAREATRVRPELISQYIKSRAEAGELNDWTVCVVANKSAAERINVAGYPVGPVRRSPVNKEPLSSNTENMVVKRVGSNRHESLDLSDSQWKRALQATRAAARGKMGRNQQPLDPTIPYGTPLRHVRDPQQGLLLIYPVSLPTPAGVSDAPALVGFAASFPASDTDDAVEYLVNDIYLDETLDQDRE